MVLDGREGVRALDRESRGPDSSPSHSLAASHSLTKLHFLLYKMQIGFFLYLAKGIANWKRDSESTLMKEKQLYCADPTLGTVETLLGLAKIL